jgi:hypothetical protein
LATKYLLAIIGAVFLVFATARITAEKGRVSPASRTWLIIAFIFAAVSVWLWTQGAGGIGFD